MQFRRSFRALALYFCAVFAALAADFRPGVVLVKFHPDATADDIAELQTRKGLRLTKHIRLFGIYAYAYDDAKAGPAEFAAELAKEPIVQTAEPDFVRELKAVDPEYPNQWSLHNTGQVVNGKSGPAGIDIRWPEANLVYKPKSPLIVGVIDSGVTLLHPDLVASIHAKTSESANGFNGIDEDGNGLIDDLWGYDWYDLDPLPLDQNGHGTLVSSIIAGTIGNGEGIAGITNSVKIRGYRVFNQFGRSGQPKFKSGGYAVSDVMASLATAVDDGCKVINLSLGGGAYSVLEAGVFEEIATMQVLCVISSGNDGKNNDQTPTYPASYPAASIIAVAAQDRTGGLASFSNYGVQTTDLAAPGTDIRGADVTRRVIYSNDFSSGANGWAPFRYTNSDYSFASWTISGGYLVDRTYGSYYSPWTDTYARSPLIDARNYSGVRVQYDGIFDVANDLLSADLSFDGLNWDSFRQYTGTGSGVDQFDASDMDFSRFYLRFRLSSGGSYQGIGVGVRSVTVSAINDLDTTNPSYQFSSGTSFSAPIVSGVVCMVWTHQPSLTAVQVKEIILKSVRKVPALDGKVLTGGMVDAEAALKLADVYAGNVLPAVSVPPRGGFFLQGDAVTFSVVATPGLPVTYQWRKNGVNIAGERGSTFSLGSLALADAGLYDVVVTSQAGSVTSASAQVTVSARLPSIVTQPTLPAAVMVAGEAYQLSCAVAGTPPFAYQWMKNGVAISGATSASLSIARLASTDAGAYTVKVINAAGSVVSSSVNVTVVQRPAFTTDLPTAPVSLLAGTSKVLSVVATGTPAPTYQWRKNGAPIAGAIGPSYVALAGTVEGTTTYDVVIANTAGTATSAATTIATCLPAAVTAAPVARSVVSGQAASFTVTAGGTGPFTYQWMKNGVAIAGATSATYDIAAVSGAQAGLYSVKVTGPVGAATSPGVNLSVLGFTTDLPTAPVSLLAGTSKVLSVVATGTPAPTYQWRRNGAPIAGAVGPSYVALAGTVEGASTYDVVITNTAGTATSATATIATCLPAAVTTAPVARSVVSGQAASFTVTAGGTGPFTYQWMKNGVAIAGATSATYDIAAVSGAQAGLYSVKVTGPVGAATSPGVNLSVLGFTTDLPTAPVSLLAGTSKVLSVVATGTPAPTYQWRKNGTPIAGAVGPSYVALAGTVEGASTYDVVITNAVGTATSAATTITTCLPAAVTTSPVARNVVAGQPTSFSVTAGGTGPFTYQWMRNGVAIAGATSATYDLAAASAAQAGLYSVKVTGPASSVTSPGANLSVLGFTTDLPTTPVSLLAGTSKVLSVVATGTPAPTYQWRKNGSPVAGAIGPSYVALAGTIEGASTYDVVITNSAGTLTSGSVTITTCLPAAVAAAPVARNVVAGQPTSFTVTAGGTGPFTYQWMRNGVAIAGATSATYDLTAASAAQAGLYSVKVTGPASSATSVGATLSVLGFISDLPTAPVGLLGGASKVLSVVATGTPAPTYQWRKNGSPIAGAIGPSYVALAGTVEGTNTYDVVITNTAGTATSAAATIATCLPAAVTTSPVARNVVAGQPTSFSVSVSGTGPLTYQWMLNGVAIAGATSSTYDLAAASAAQAGLYSVKVTGPANTVTSAGAALSVLSPFVFTTQPLGALTTTSIATGLPKVLSVAVSGTGPFTYQWRKDGVAIAGATLATYSIPAQSSEGSAAYDVVVSGPVSTSSSNPVRVDTCVPVSVTQNPVSVARAVGQPASFTVTAGGTGPFTYQWLKNGVAIAGATAATYAIDSVQTTSAASYSVKITGPVGSVTSAAASLVLHTAPSIVTQPAALYKGAGQSATFSVTAAGTGPFTYQWSKDGNPIAGANAASLAFAAVAAQDAGRYSVSVSNDVGAVLSQEGELTVVALPTIVTPPTPVNVVDAKVTRNYRAIYFGFNNSPDGWATVPWSGKDGEWPSSGWYWSDQINEGPKASNIECANGGGELVSPAISLAGLTSPELRFWHARAGTAFAVLVSTDKVNWTPLFSETASQSLGDDIIVSLGAYAGQTCYLKYVSDGPALVDEVAVWGTGLAKEMLELSVYAAGQGMSYQWYKDGVAIAGATLRGLVLADANAATAAGSYSVKVTNAAGSVTSSAAYVGLSPSIATQPTSASKLNGQAASFSVVAAGTAPFTYQWYRDGTPISGATNATCSIASASTQTAGNYYVVVANSVGQVTSQTVALGVTLPPTLTSQPQSATVVRKLSQGTLAKFDFDSGEQGWVFGAMPDDLSSIPWFFGWDDPTQLNGLVECDNYSGRYGHQYARSPWISLVGASNVQLAFSANTYIAGAGSLNLTVEASPDGVNWTVLKSNCPSFNDPGYQSSYSVSLAAFAGKGCYLRARLQGANGSSGVIDDFIVTGYGYPAANVAFSATAVSTVPCTYQWYRNGVAIAGATASTYTPPDPYASTAAGAYTVVVTNAAGSVTSSAASLTQVDPPAITSQPAAQVVTGSYLSPLTAANYTFDTGASGWVYGAYSDNQSPYHWDWDASTSSVTDRMFGTAYASYADSYTQSPWINLSTSIGSTLTFNSAWSLYPDALDTFFVQASSNGTNWTTLKAYTGSGSGSTTVSLSAYDLYGCYLRFGLYSSPLYNGYGINVYDARVSGSTLIPGAPATFSVAASSSTACTYQWFKDGAPITGASASTYSIPYTYSSDAGYYSVRVTNSAGSVTSTSARLSFK